MLNLPDICTVQDLASVLGVSRQAIHLRLRAGKLPIPFRVGRAYAWHRSEVLAWLERNPIR